MGEVFEKPCLKTIIHFSIPFGATEITQYLSLALLVGVIYERASFWFIVYDCTTHIVASLEIYSVWLAWIPLCISVCSIFSFWCNGVIFSVAF